MLLTIIVFVLVVGIVIIAHEFGHFLIARMNGIKVVEFAVGMGPVLLKYQRGDTRYVLRLLPIGGACMFENEDGLETAMREDADKNDKDTFTESGELADAKMESEDASFLRNVEKTGETSFPEANVWARIATVIAGPFFNIVLAFLLSMILVSAAGETLPTVTDVMDGYPAQEAGMQAGDLIKNVGGDKIYLQNEVSLAIALNGNKPITVVYERDGEKYSTILTPKYSEEDGGYYIGLMFGEHVEAKGFNVLKYSAYEVRYWLRYTVKSLLMLVQGQVSKDDVSGPVGIAVAIDETIEVAKPYGVSTVILTLINFAVLLSVNLGVLNLIPIPALDGGRLLFLLVEVVRGKPIPPEKEGIVNFVGFVALMILMVFVLYNDIAKIFVH